MSKEKIIHIQPMNDINDFIMADGEGRVVSWAVPDPFTMSFQEAGKIYFYKDGRVVCELTNPDEAAKQFVALVTEKYLSEFSEAEQRGYERARAECAADTRRFEWLENLPFADVGRLPNGWEICINNVRHWDMQPTLREAIDAAMEGGNG